MGEAGDHEHDYATAGNDSDIESTASDGFHDAKSQLHPQSSKSKVKGKAKSNNVKDAGRPAKMSTGTLATRKEKLKASPQPSPSAYSPNSIGTLSRVFVKFHLTLGILLVTAMLLTPAIRNSIMERAWYLLAGYILFELGNWGFCKLVLKDMNFPVNYLSLVCVRCFLVFNTQPRLTLESFYPGLRAYALAGGSSAVTSWSISQAEMISLFFVVAVVIPVMLISTKTYIGHWTASCLVGANLSTSLAVIVLLSSLGLSSSSTDAPTVELNGHGFSFTMDKSQHFRLCLIWIYVTSIVTFVSIVSICQRMLKRFRSKKEVPASQVGHFMPELMLMVVVLGLTLAYVQLVHPNLRLADIFPPFQIAAIQKQFRHLVQVGIGSGFTYILSLWCMAMGLPRENTPLTD